MNFSVYCLLSRAESLVQNFIWNLNDHNQSLDRKKHHMSIFYGTITEIKFLMEATSHIFKEFPVMYTHQHTAMFLIYIISANEDVLYKHLCLNTQLF